MELAEDMNVGPMSATFKLKKNATFQDGTPVTAKDVKWSLDRAVTVGGFPTFQMGAGSLTKPEQFVVVDDNTFRVDFARKDRLTIPDLAVIVPGVFNSELVKKNATEKDPWGMEYTKQNTAGSGAYRVVSWNAGTEVIMERNDKWVGGPLPIAHYRPKDFWPAGTNVKVNLRLNGLPAGNGIYGQQDQKVPFQKSAARSSARSTSPRTGSSSASTTRWHAPSPSRPVTASTAPARAPRSSWRSSPRSTWTLRPPASTPRTPTTTTSATSSGPCGSPTPASSCTPDRGPPPHTAGRTSATAAPAPNL